MIKTIIIKVCQLIYIIINLFIGRLSSNYHKILLILLIYYILNEIITIIIIVSYLFYFILFYFIKLIINYLYF